MLPIRTATVIPSEDTSQIPVARRAALEAGRTLGLDTDTLARAEIIAVELARNILLHGQTVTSASGVPTRRIQRPGELILSSTLDGGGIQIVAVDSGRGIGNISGAMVDGFSTAGTPGLGLGAVKRLSRHFDLYSVVAPEAVRGTVVSAVVAAESKEPTGDGRAGVISTALPGEEVSGDSWAMCEYSGRSYFLMVDGLGHGLYAHEAAAVAVNGFLRMLQNGSGRPAPPLAEIIHLLHGPMHSTRGAAAAVVSVDPEKKLVTFCGVGNISGELDAPDGNQRSMLSHNGTLGHQIARVQEFTYAYQPGELLILHSDGIHTGWKLNNMPSLSRQASATIAGAIYREAWRGRDDATVLVARLA